MIVQLAWFASATHPAYAPMTDLDAVMAVLTLMVRRILMLLWS